MLNDAIYAYFFALTKYNESPIGSREEKAFQILAFLAQEDLKDNCRSYAEYRRVMHHMQYLSNRVVWPCLYKNATAIHHSIGRKAD